MKIILTNMCLIKNSEGKLLFLNRVKSTWPGITFPGGHVEENETIEESVIREIKEETSLILKDVKFVNYIEWNSSEENIKEIGFFFYSDQFEGELSSSLEGKVFFEYLNNIKKSDYSLDFEKILEIYKNYL